MQIPDGIAEICDVLHLAVRGDFKDGSDHSFERRSGDEVLAVFKPAEVVIVLVAAVSDENRTQSFNFDFEFSIQTVRKRYVV